MQLVWFFIFLSCFALPLSVSDPDILRYDIFFGKTDETGAETRSTNETDAGTDSTNGTGARTESTNGTGAGTESTNETGAGTDSTNETGAETNSTNETGAGTDSTNGTGPGTGSTEETGAGKELKLFALFLATESTNEIGDGTKSTSENLDGTELTKETGARTDPTNGTGTGTVSTSETGARTESTNEAGAGTDSTTNGTGAEKESTNGTVAGTDSTNETGAGTESTKETGAGKDLKLFVRLIGLKERQTKLHELKTSVDVMVNGSSDSQHFSIQAQDVGQIMKMKIEATGKGAEFSFSYIKLVVSRISKKYSGESHKREIYFFHSQLLNANNSETEIDVYNRSSYILRRYDILVGLSDNDDNATDSHVFVRFIGEDGQETIWYQLKNTRYHTKKPEGRLRKYHFYAKNVGKITRMHVWIVPHKNSTDCCPHWSFDYLELEIDYKKEEYFFNCSGWIGSQAIHEIPVFNISFYIHYDIFVQTSRIGNAGTNSRVYIRFTGEYGRETDVRQFDTTKKELSEGSFDYYYFDKTRDVGNITKMYIKTDESKFDPLWFFDYLIVKIPSKNQEYYFEGIEWIASRWVEHEVGVEPPTTTSTLSTTIENSSEVTTPDTSQPQSTTIQTVGSVVYPTMFRYRPGTQLSRFGTGVVGCIVLFVLIILIMFLNSRRRLRDNKRSKDDTDAANSKVSKVTPKAKIKDEIAEKGKAKEKEKMTPVDGSNVVDKGDKDEVTEKGKSKEEEKMTSVDGSNVVDQGDKDEVAEKGKSKEKEKMTSVDGSNVVDQGDKDEVAEKGKSKEKENMTPMGGNKVVDKGVGTAKRGKSKKRMRIPVPVCESPDTD